MVLQYRVMLRVACAPPRAASGFEASLHASGTRWLDDDHMRRLRLWPGSGHHDRTRGTCHHALGRGSEEEVLQVWRLVCAYDDQVGGQIRRQLRDLARRFALFHVDRDGLLPLPTERG